MKKFMLELFNFIGWKFFIIQKILVSKDRFINLQKNPYIKTTIDSQAKDIPLEWQISTVM